MNTDLRGRRSAVAQRCDCYATVVSSIPIWGSELLCINIFISSLWHQGKSPGVEFHHSTRNVSENSAESGERGVLTKGYHCLHCYMPDTA